MKSKRLRTVLATAILTAIGAVGSAQAADIIPVLFDAQGTGYYDTTPVAPVGGNPGTTRGEQRRIVAQYAAALWGTVLQSNVPIYVGARFTALAPNVLGSAGSASAFVNVANGKPGVIYGGALADALVGSDLRPGFVDINSNFSTNFTFYYGLDGKTPAGLTNFLDVVMHEYAHGLGFASFANASTGALLAGYPDAYNVFAYDNTTAKFWPQMTNAERQAAAINTGNVVFTGPLAVAGAQVLLDKRIYFRATAPAAVAGDYPYGTASFGASPTPGNFGGQVALGTDSVGTLGDGCEPITSDVVGKIALMDRGVCGFAVKAKNAQNAGAAAVIIADNVVAANPIGLGGTDASITIPTVSVTKAVGDLFKANLPVSIGFVADPVLLQGADNLGRPRLFAPNPVETGSSFSHYDSVSAPNLLMEPAINGSLRSYINLDITPALMADVGWKINPGNAKIGTCDTGVDAVSDGGIILGANVAAQYAVCKMQFPGNKLQYTKCMTDYGTRMRSAGLISSTQHMKIVQCTSLN